MILRVPYVPALPCLQDFVPAACSARAPSPHPIITSTPLLLIRLDLAASRKPSPPPHGRLVVLSLFIITLYKYIKVLVLLDR